MNINKIGQTLLIGGLSAALAGQIIMIAMEYTNFKIYNWFTAIGWIVILASILGLQVYIAYQVKKSTKNIDDIDMKKFLDVVAKNDTNNNADKRCRNKG